MTELDEKLVPKALELLNRFGKTVTYTKVVTSDEPVRGELTETETSYSVKISPPKAMTEYITNETYQHGDLSTVIAASGLVFTPAIGDEIVLNSKTYKVFNHESVYSGDEIAIYKLFMRSF